MEELINVVDWSRAQFALTAIYHWLFVPLTLGLGVIIAIMETIYYKTKSEKWLATTKFWMTIFGVNFAIGVATGIILEFEFGTNWQLQLVCGRHLRRPASRGGHPSLLHGVDVYRRDVFWLEESKPQVPPCRHMAHRHRREPVGTVDSCG